MPVGEALVRRRGAERRAFAETPPDERDGHRKTLDESARGRAELEAAQRAKLKAARAPGPPYSRRVVQDMAAAGRVPAPAAGAGGVAASEAQDQPGPGANQQTQAAPTPARPSDGAAASRANRHVPPLELEPFSDEWRAWYAARRLNSQIDRLNDINRQRTAAPRQARMSPSRQIATGTRGSFRWPSPSHLFQL